MLLEANDVKRSLSIPQKAKQPEYYHVLVFSKAFKWAPKEVLQEPERTISAPPFSPQLGPQSPAFHWAPLFLENRCWLFRSQWWRWGKLIAPEKPIQNGHGRDASHRNMTSEWKQAVLSRRRTAVHFIFSQICRSVWFQRKSSIQGMRETSLNLLHSAKPAS